MDKETLSNYGWIVILVLILAVLLALATPFGNFIAGAFKSTYAGFGMVSDKALGIVIPGGNLGDGSTGETPEYDHNAPELHPDDGTTPQDGDTYEHGDYIYTYWEEDTYVPGWQVAINENVTDRNQTTYGPILESINSKPITNMEHIFIDCTSLKTAPVIPNSVVFMADAFNGCHQLTIAPVIPNSVMHMHYTFAGCSELKTYVGSTDPDGDFSGYVIPSSVTHIIGTFSGCGITTAPVIPSSVMYMQETFAYCHSLTGTIEINATNLTEDGYSTYDDCFFETTESITLTGTCPQLAELAATANNGNVTVQ